MNRISSALLLKIESLRPKLSSMEGKATDYILAHPQEVIHLSISGLAENSGVSDATVVRLCKRLGMQGYQELKIALAQDIVSPIEYIHEDINEEDSGTDIMHKVFNSSIHSLQYTERILDEKMFEKAVNALLSAKNIHIYGCGNSGAVAYDLQHKLMRAGLFASAFTDSHMQCIAATLLHEGDVCVGISHSGSSRDIIDAVQLAREARATVICLTNIGKNPLSEISDIRLDTASRETEYHIVALASRISQYAIIDSLHTAIEIALRKGGNRDMYVVERALKKKKY